MGTNLPRPQVGACVRVLATVERHTGIEGLAGREGIVVGFDAPAPLLTRDRARIVGETAWDLRVVFLGGRGSALDMDEVEIVYGSPWWDDDGIPWRGPDPSLRSVRNAGGGDV